MQMIGTYDVIAQCNKILKKHFADLLKPIVKNFDENSVLFDFPSPKNLEANKVAADKPVLGIVLWQVSPNAVLRNEMPDEGYEQSHLPLNLHYLLIASAPDKEMETTMLGKIVESFHHHPSIQSKDEKGKDDKSKDGQEITFLPESLDLSDIANFWRNLQMDSFKTFLSYQAQVRMEGRKAEKPDSPLKKITLKIHDTQDVDLKKPLTESTHAVSRTEKKE